MSLSDLTRKAAKRRQQFQGKGPKNPAEKRSGTNEENYLFDYSINYRDVEKFSLCKRLLATEVGKQFGECANIIEFGEHFQFYAPDYPDDDDWNDPDIGPRVRMEYGTEYAAFIKQKSVYDTRCAQVYHLIWSKCSVAMQNAVKEHEDFEVWDRHKDPLSLWLRVVDVSMNGTGATENDSKKINEARHRFDRVHQRQNESVGEFYNRFTENYDAMTSQGAYLIQPMIPQGLGAAQRQQMTAMHAEQEESMKAMAFLNKLDKGRFSGLLDDLENSNQFGRDEYPRTLVDAYAMANRYRKNGLRVDLASRGRVERFDAAFTSSTVSEGKKGPKAYKEKPRAKGDKDKVKCFHCNESGHLRNSCPQLVKALRYFAKSGKSIDQLRDDIKEVLISFKGLEEYIFTEQSSRPFTNKDLLLDNQATLTVFCNEDYVTNIRKSDEVIYIAGVSKDKLKVDLIADVDGIGTVYFNKDAIANILCFYDINERFGVKFDSNRFSVKIPELHRTLQFKPFGKLYVCKNASFLSNNFNAGNDLRSSTYNSRDSIINVAEEVPPQSEILKPEAKSSFKSNDIALNYSRESKLDHSDVSQLNNDDKTAGISIDLLKNSYTMKDDQRKGKESVRSKKKHLNSKRMSKLVDSNRQSMVSSLENMEKHNRDFSSEVPISRSLGTNLERSDLNDFSSKSSGIDLSKQQSVGISESILKGSNESERKRSYSRQLTDSHCVKNRSVRFGDNDFSEFKSKSDQTNFNQLRYKYRDEPKHLLADVKAELESYSGANTTWSQSEGAFLQSLSGRMSNKGLNDDGNSERDISTDATYSRDAVLVHSSMGKGSNNSEFGPWSGTSTSSCLMKYSFSPSIQQQKEVATSLPLEGTSIPSRSDDLKVKTAKVGMSTEGEHAINTPMDQCSAMISTTEKALDGPLVHCTLVPQSCSSAPMQNLLDRERVAENRCHDLHFSSDGKIFSTVPMSCDDNILPYSSDHGDNDDVFDEMERKDDVDSISSVNDQWDENTIDYKVDDRICANSSHTNNQSSITNTMSELTNHNSRALTTTLESSNQPQVSSSVLVNTVDSNMMKFTKREVKDAELAMQLYTMMGKPSIKDFLNMIRHNLISNCPVTVKDVERALEIYGKDLGAVVGRSLSYKPDALDDDPFVRNKTDYTLLCMDIMFINGLAFLVSISKGYNVLVVRYLNDRKMSTLENSIKQTLASYSKYNVKISMIVFDGEKAISALKASIEGMGVQLEQSSKNEHVATIERAIRQIKERVRAFINTLPYRITKDICVYLVYYLVAMINNVPRSTSVIEMSPKEKLTGKKLDYKKDFKLQFGEYCQANEEDTIKNSMKSRTFPAICLGPVGNIQGSYYFLNLNSWHIVKRRAWVKFPIPNGIIDKINHRSDYDKENKAIDLELLNAVNHNDDEEEEILFDGEEEEGKEEEPQWDYEPHYFHEENDEETVENDKENDEEIVQEADEGTHRYNLRKTPQRDAWNSKNNNNAFVIYRMILATYNIKKAIQEYGAEGTESMLKEMKQLHDKGVFEPVDCNLLTPMQKIRILRSLMFVKRKRNGSLKSRFLADGSRQVRSLSQVDSSSPTVSTEAVFIQSAIDAMEKRHRATVDVEGAYLHALMDEEVLIRVEPTVADILVKIDSQYDKHRVENGSLVLRLIRALYGCIQSARLFYENISKVLLDFGFVKNDYDRCVFNKEMYGKQCTILIHVDDLKISCQDRRGVDDVINHLKKVYGNVNVYRDDIVDYLGMDFDYSKPGVVSISMKGLIDQVLNEVPVTKISRTPASVDLFVVNPDSKELDKELREKFHSIVAKLLYMAKRGRPDILTAVSFLTTRVLMSTEQDWSKLERIIQYLKGTRDLVLNLTADNKITINAFIDASFACHPDGKSHTGEMISLGGGAVISKSSKQKLVTKSSTEAELVGLSDATPTVLWVKNFLEAQGHKTDSAIIHQDNKSTIILAEKGKSTTNRTRHINIRYFFIKDRIETKDVKVVYTSTEEMVADFFSKPVQGALFEKFRDIILNDKQS